MNKINIYHTKSLRNPSLNLKDKKKVFSYTSTLSGESAANEAFKIFNAPVEVLSYKERILNNSYRKNKIRSFSVGDVVQVNDSYFYCDSFGWEEITKD